MTVGAIKVGSAPNVISDRAELLVNVRAYDNAVRDTILKAVDRIVRAECQASGSPQEPTLETIATFPLTVNDPAVTEAVTKSFTQAFGADRVEELARSRHRRTSASFPRRSACPSPTGETAASCPA